MVVLWQVPATLLEGLPAEDQRAILESVGKPILLVGYDHDGRAELEFTDSKNVVHTIFVNTEFISKP